MGEGEGEGREGGIESREEMEGGRACERPTLAFFAGGGALFACKYLPPMKRACTIINPKLVFEVYEIQRTGCEK